MNTRTKKLGAAALLCLIVALVGVFALPIHISTQGVVSVLAMLMIGSTVTYLDPSTTAPTAAKAANVQSQAATVNFGDSDTTATITHYFQSSAAALAALRPWVMITPVSVGTAFPALSWALNTNTVVITKGNATTGSGGTYNVIIQRPWTALASNIPSVP